MVEWINPSDGSGKASDLIVRGKYVARNVTKKGDQLKTKPNKIEFMWLYEGTIIEFTNEAVVNSVRLEVYPETLKPPFKLPDWFAPLVVGTAVTIAVGRNGARRSYGRRSRILGKRRREIKAPRDLTG